MATVFDFARGLGGFEVTVSDAYTAVEWPEEVPAFATLPSETSEGLRMWAPARLPEALPSLWWALRDAGTGLRFWVALAALKRVGADPADANAIAALTGRARPALDTFLPPAVTNEVMWLGKEAHPASDLLVRAAGG